jgi:hypothetical protein
MTSLIGVAGACGGVAPILAYAASAAALADSAAAATLPSSPSEARGHRARAGCRADAPDRRHGADVARELAVAGRQARRIGSVRAGRGVRLRQADYAVGCCPVLVHRRRLHLLGARFHVRAGLYPGAEMQKEQQPDREHDARSEAAEGSALADQDRAARGLISRTSPTRSVSSPRPAGCAARALPRPGLAAQRTDHRARCPLPRGQAAIACRRRIKGSRPEPYCARAPAGANSFATNQLSVRIHSHRRMT